MEEQGRTEVSESVVVQALCRTDQSPSRGRHVEDTEGRQHDAPSVYVVERAVGCLANRSGVLHDWAGDSTNWTVLAVQWTRATGNSSGGWATETLQFVGEGIYDRATGRLCLAMCRVGFSIPMGRRRYSGGRLVYDVRSAPGYRDLIDGTKLWKAAAKGPEGATKDCRAQMTIQYPKFWAWPLSFLSGPLAGKISSLRERSDPLYFAPLTFTDPDYTFAAKRTNEADGLNGKRSMAALGLALGVLLCLRFSMKLRGNPDIAQGLAASLLVLPSIGVLLALLFMGATAVYWLVRYEQARHGTFRRDPWRDEEPAYSPVMVLLRAAFVAALAWLDYSFVRAKFGRGRAPSLADGAPGGGKGRSGADGAAAGASEEELLLRGEGRGPASSSQEPFLRQGASGGRLQSSLSAQPRATLGTQGSLARAGELCTPTLFIVLFYHACFPLVALAAGWRYQISTPSFCRTYEPDYLSCASLFQGQVLAPLVQDLFLVKQIAFSALSGKPVPGPARKFIYGFILVRLLVRMMDEGALVVGAWYLLVQFTYFVLLCEPQLKTVAKAAWQSCSRRRN